MPILPGLNVRLSYDKIDLINEHTWLTFSDLNNYSFNNTKIINDNIEFTFEEFLYKGKTSNSL